MARIQIGPEVARNLFVGDENNHPVVKGEDRGVLHENGLSINDIVSTMHGNEGRPPVKSYIEINNSNFDKLRQFVGLDLSDSYRGKLDDRPIYLVNNSLSTDGSGTYEVLTGEKANSLVKKNILHPSEEGGVKSSLHDDLLDKIRSTSEHLNYMAQRNFLEQSRDGWRSIFSGLKNTFSPDGPANQDNTTEKLLDVNTGDNKTLIIAANIVQQQSETMKESLATMDSVSEQDPFIAERITTSSDDYHKSLSSYYEKASQGDTNISKDEAYAHAQSRFLQASDSVQENLQISQQIMETSKVLDQNTISMANKKLLQGADNIEEASESMAGSKSLLRLTEMREKIEELQKQMKELMDKIMEIVNKILGVSDARSADNNTSSASQPASPRPNM